MERIQAINPDRILWCCADRGITPEAMAADLGLAAATLERALSGGEGLTLAQLRKVAEYFGRGLLFFLDPAPVQAEQVHTTVFRTLANQKPDLSAALKTLIERSERQRDIYLSLREDLGAEDFPAFDPPALDRRHPAAAAAAARHWLGLGERNDFDSYRQAIEARGVLVFRSNGYAGRWQIPKDSPILGFCLYHRECPVIVVKKQAAEAQQVFTLMHELGHLLLRQTSSIDDEHDLHAAHGDEREANAFAGHLLVPDAFLNGIDTAGRPAAVEEFDRWLEPQRRAWGVSGEVILRRLLDAGRLSAEDSRAYRDWKAGQTFAEDGGGNRAWRHREPRHIFGDRFVRSVLDALAARQISLAKASSYLDGLKIADLHKLERHCAGA